MKKIIILVIMILLVSSSNKIVYAIDTESLYKSCDRVSSVLSNTFTREKARTKVIAFIRIDTINESTQGSIKKLHKEFCTFLTKKGYTIESYYIHPNFPPKKKYRKKQKWISDCENPISEVLATTKVIELVIIGDDFIDSFYMLQRNDRFFYHHLHRGEGHQKFFEYIYDKLQTELREDYSLLPNN